LDCCVFVLQNGLELLVFFWLTARSRNDVKKTSTDNLGENGEDSLAFFRELHEESVISFNMLIKGRKIDYREQQSLQEVGV